MVDLFYAQGQTGSWYDFLRNCICIQITDPFFGTILSDSMDEGKMQIKTFFISTTHVLYWRLTSMVRRTEFVGFVDGISISGKRSDGFLRAIAQVPKHLSTHRNGCVPI